MMKIDMLPRCGEQGLDGSHDCGKAAVARVEAPEHGIDEMYVCEHHVKEYLWAQCWREASANPPSKGGRIKLRPRDLT